MSRKPRRGPGKRERRRRPNPRPNENNGRGGDSERRTGASIRDSSVLGDHDMVTQAGTGRSDLSDPPPQTQPKSSDSAERARAHVTEAIANAANAKTPKQFRRLSRDLLTILQFYDGDGEPVVGEAEAKNLIRLAAYMATSAGATAKHHEELSRKAGNPKLHHRAHRAWGVDMRVLMALARLEQQDGPDRQEHVHVHASLSTEEKWRLIEERLRNEAIRRGLLKEGDGGEGNEETNGRRSKS